MVMTGFGASLVDAVNPLVGEAEEEDEDVEL